MWKILGQEIKFEGWRIRVRQDRVIAPSGKETTWDVVMHPGAVAIVARPTPDEVVLIRQQRYATREELIELPAGTLEKGENPLETARRELKEETGYAASCMELRATFYTTPGFSDELMYLYEASGLEPGPQRLEDDEDIQVDVVSVDEALRMTRDGRIRDAKTLVGLLIVLRPS
jgi:ADP-ribose pyrophosphatase